MTRWDAASTLDALQYAYPIALLAFFLLAFTVRSIATSANSNTNDAEQPLFGPGGKPLPTSKKSQRLTRSNAHAEISRSRKLVFEWLSVAVCLTWVGNAVNVIIHALYSRKQGWWCGQSAVVSFPPPPSRPLQCLHTRQKYATANTLISYRSTSSVHSSFTLLFSSPSWTRNHPQLGRS